MTDTQPTTDLDPRFSTDDAKPLAWEEARRELASAPTYWISTVRPDGRPHVTPMVGVWLDDALYFCTGPTEQKARNLEQNQHVAVTTGHNGLDGLDLVLEADAVRVRDGSRLERIADAYEGKYDETFHFQVRGDAFFPKDPDGGGGEAYVFEVKPKKAFGFGGDQETWGQTRWRF